jgi:hypothetical protein
MAFTDELRQAADPIWSAAHEHPFVRGIGEGSLDSAKFRHYVRQDYLFLIDYARLLALGCARAPRLDEMTRFAELAGAVLGSEMALHRSYAGEWGVSPAALEDERPTPTTRAYTDFLLRVAALGDYGELAAALLPCMWGYRTRRHPRRARPPRQRALRALDRRIRRRRVRPAHGLVQGAHRPGGRNQRPPPDGRRLPHLESLRARLLGCLLAGGASFTRTQHSLTSGRFVWSHAASVVGLNSGPNRLEIGYCRPFLFASGRFATESVWSAPIGRQNRQQDMSFCRDFYGSNRPATSGVTGRARRRVRNSVVGQRGSLRSRPSSRRRRSRRPRLITGAGR